jgi:hypothetical protein
MLKTQVLLFLVIAVAASILALMLYRAKKKRAEKSKNISELQHSQAPDITKDDVNAQELPENEWVVLGRDLINKGELRLALRAFYLAAIASLGQNEIIRVAKHKSNRDYLLEVSRRSYRDPHMQNTFEESIILFERSWYGSHIVTRQTMDSFIAKYERISSCADRQ